MIQLTGLALALFCWTLGGLFQFTFSTPQGPASLPTQSASLLYIYASDPIYWPELTGNLLRDNDTLLILPDVVYKVWCEVLPEGRPRIDANRPGVIAHQPAPKMTMAYVELERDLILTLKELGDKAEPVKLWCDYSDGAKEYRTEVYLKPFALANTTCDFSQLSGLVAKGSKVNFVCTSSYGYPRPEHRCDIVPEDGALQMPADVVSVAISDEGHTLTRLSIPATRETQGARIKCFATQQIEYDGRSFREIRVQRVFPYGEPDFKFATESNKSCEQSLLGNYGVSVRCQSEGGQPDTEHKCWVSTARSPLGSLPLMAKIQGRSTYITEVNFDNSWIYQDGTVTCSLFQQAFFERNFTFRIPAFKESTKSCKFAKLKSGVLAKCHSGVGRPVSEHLCAIHVESSAKPLTPNETIIHGNDLHNLFFVPFDSLPRGSQIMCAIKQKEFLTKTFTYHVPRYIESKKTCRFTSSTSQDVQAICEFSAGHPATRAECSYQIANSSEIVDLKPNAQISDAAKQIFSVSYIVKHPGPEVSHLGGSVICRVYQGVLFVQTFVHGIPEYYAPETTTTVTTLTTLAETTTKTQFESSTLSTLTKSRKPASSSGPKMISNLSNTPETQTVNATKKLDTVRTTWNLTTQQTHTKAPNLGRSQKATPPILKAEKRANISFIPTVSSVEPSTTEQSELRTSNQTAMTLSLALLIALILILLMSLPIHILRRCLKRNRKDVTATSLGESQASAATLLSATAPIRRVHLVHTPHQLQLSSEDALRTVLCDVCNYRGYRVSKRDGIPDIDQYSMFEFGYQIDPTNKRKSLLVDAQIRNELNQNRKEFRFSM